MFWSASQRGLLQLMRRRKLRNSRKRLPPARFRLVKAVSFALQPPTPASGEPTGQVKLMFKNNTRSQTRRKQVCRSVSIKV